MDGSAGLLKNSHSIPFNCSRLYEGHLGVGRAEGSTRVEGRGGDDGWGAPVAMDVRGGDRSVAAIGDCDYVSRSAGVTFMNQDTAPSRHL